MDFWKAMRYNKYKSQTGSRQKVMIMSGIDSIRPGRFEKENGIEPGKVIINIPREFAHGIKDEKFSKEKETFFVKSEARPDIYKKETEPTKKTNKLDKEKVDSEEEESKNGSGNEKAEENVDLENKFEKEGF